MLDVIKVVGEFFFHAVDLGRVAVHDLRPTGYAGPHDVAVSKERHILRVPLGEGERLRPRADEAHLAAEHVPELWQLIEAVLPNDGPHAGHAVALPVLGKVAAGAVNEHAPKLHHPKNAPTQAHALLDKERPAWTLALDTEGGHGNDRQQHGGNQEDKGRIK